MTTGQQDTHQGSNQGINQGINQGSGSPMSAESLAAWRRAPMHPVAARRILRLAFGTSLCLAVSQMLAFPLSFIAPVLTMFILALPMPAPTLKKGIVFVLALLAPMVAGLAILPFLHHARWAGIVLVALALFYSFYYTARGGSPILGTFMTVGLTVVVTVGSVSTDVLILLIKALGICAAMGMVFVWIAHALLPELPPDPALAGLKKPAPPKPDPSAAGRNALRSMLIVFPLALLFMFMSASPAYTVVMIKVASMGQQASADKSREMGRDLLVSTLLGGVGAIIGWHLMGLWTSLVFYVLLITLAGLIYGRWIFQGPAVHPKFSTMSYAFLTMLVILAPAVIDDSGNANAAFYTRLGLFILIAIYGTAAVAVFDAFFSPRSPSATASATAAATTATRGSPSPGAAS